MAFVWLLEKPNTTRPIASILQGSVALRLVASEKSFVTLSRITPESHWPKLVLINSAGLNVDLLRLRGAMPGTKFIALGDKDSGVKVEDLPFLVRTLLEEDQSTPWRIDFEEMTFSLPSSGLEVPISQKEAKIIKALIDAGDAVLSREVLLEVVWQGMKVSRSTVDSNISRLRKKLDPFPIEIESVYGGGYRLKHEHTF